MAMKALLVMSFDLEQEGDIITVLQHMDPPNIPFADGMARIVVDPEPVAYIIEYLDE
jgi:hypothetical protein